MHCPTALAVTEQKVRLGRPLTKHRAFRPRPIRIPFLIGKDDPL